VGHDIEKGSSMIENEVHLNLIIDKIRKGFGKRVDGFTIQTLLYEKSLLDNVSESDIREAVNWAIDKEIITSVKRDKLGDVTLYFSTDSKWQMQSENIVLAVSTPRLSSNSIGRVMERNGFITTDSAFKRIISSAERMIRISSPFLQKNVANEAGIPDLEKIILMAYQRGCKFVILSREVYSKRAPDLGWLIELTRKNGFSEKLEIFDYHKSKNGSTVDSSTHAKLIISDEEMAYIGSAELRLNSLYKNFEVGVLLKGPKITGLVELFDSMTNLANRVY
jgi:phosphatidylserine/phosphatidylglycerophosphate/cardiolipin synthase-like enzyme